MSDLRYLIPRVIRHFMPPGLARFLLLRRWIIYPGMETDSPKLAAEHYRQDLAERGVYLSGKRILILGYGGRFGVGCALLKMGAGQVVLCEKGVHPDDSFNRTLLGNHSDVLSLKESRVLSDPNQLEVVEGDIRLLKLHPVDIILSTSVYEHLDDVTGVTRALAALTNSEGVNLHYIDLRDHFFKFPFEMLCYSERIWRGWLNPTSNHNRYRLLDYKAAFENSFSRVEINVMASEEEEFKKSRDRIRPQFLSGDPLVDSVTKLTIFADTPKIPEN
jgi:hypothetical protein